MQDMLDWDRLGLPSFLFGLQIRVSWDWKVYIRVHNTLTRRWIDDRCRFGGGDDDDGGVEEGIVGDMMVMMMMMMKMIVDDEL